MAGLLTPISRKTTDKEDQRRGLRMTQEGFTTVFVSRAKSHNPKGPPREMGQ